MIGQNIKRMRELKGWSQEQLARMMGYKSKSTINKIEKNINDVSQKTLDKFAKVFKCEATELLFDDPLTNAFLQHRKNPCDPHGYRDFCCFIAHLFTADKWLKIAYKKVHNTRIAHTFSALFFMREYLFGSVS